MLETNKMVNNLIRLLVLPVRMLGVAGSLMAMLAIGSAMLAVPASASSVLELTGVSGNTYDGISAFPYYVSVNGGTPIEMMCDDAQTDIYVGYSWNADAYSLDTADLSDLKFASEGSASKMLDEYEVAAYIESGAMTGSINAGDANAAVWSIFDPGFSTSADHSAITTILNNAQTAVNAGNLNFSGITIYMPSPLKSSQEFITGIVTTNIHQSATPEPATYAMLGGGLFLLGLFGRRLRNRS